MDTVVVITGASAGIGAELARQLGRSGAKLGLAARRQTELQAVARDWRRTGARGRTTDVTRRAEVERLRDEILARFGRIDVWVNNAGRGVSRLVAELTDEDVDAMWRDNFKSALYGIQAVLPHFKERGTGHIVNVSSGLAKLPLAPFRAAYGASKAALNMLSACLRVELHGKFPGIAVSVVMPGVVATDFGLNALNGGPDSRKMPGAQSVEEAVAEIVKVIEVVAGGGLHRTPGTRRPRAAI